MKHKTILLRSAVVAVAAFLGTFTAIEANTTHASDRRLSAVGSCHATQGFTPQNTLYPGYIRNQSFSQSLYLQCAFPSDDTVSHTNSTMAFAYLLQGSEPYQQSEVQACAKDPLGYAMTCGRIRSAMAPGRVGLFLDRRGWNSAEAANWLPYFLVRLGARSELVGFSVRN